MHEYLTKPVDVRRQDRAPHRHTFEHGQGRTFPKRRKDSHVKTRETSGHITLEPHENDVISNTETFGLRFELGLKRTLADNDETSLG